MKIVDKAQFLSLPAGTVFSEYEPTILGNLCVKGDSISPSQDFCFQSLSDAVAASSSDEWNERMEAALHEGISLSMDLHCQQRDGSFDDEQRFAVWERDDVSQLIDRITSAFEAAYVRTPYAKVETLLPEVASEATLPSPTESQSK